MGCHFTIEWLDEPNGRIYSYQLLKTKKRRSKTILGAIRKSYHYHDNILVTLGTQLSLISYLTTRYLAGYRNLSYVGPEILGLLGSCV